MRAEGIMCDKREKEREREMRERVEEVAIVCQSRWRLTNVHS